jgi:hypothetical protein
MEKEYIVNENGSISYTEDGVLYSFLPDPENSYYQAYLNKDKKVVDEL